MQHGGRKPVNIGVPDHQVGRASRGDPAEPRRAACRSRPTARMGQKRLIEPDALPRRETPGRLAVDTLPCEGCVQAEGSCGGLDRGIRAEDHGGTRLEQSAPGVRALDRAPQARRPVSGRSRGSRSAPRPTASTRPPATATASTRSSTRPAVQTRAFVMSRPAPGFMSKRPRCDSRAPRHPGPRSRQCPPEPRGPHPRACRSRSRRLARASLCAR